MKMEERKLINKSNIKYVFDLTKTRPTYTGKDIESAINSMTVITDYEIIKPYFNKLSKKIRHFMYHINPSSSESDYACNYILDLIKDMIDEEKEKYGEV